MASSVDPSKAKAMSWDPKSPFALLLPSLLQGEPAAVDTFLSHPGTGCDDFELAALLKVLQAHEDYYADTAAATGPEYSITLKQLSQEYRLALHACITSWELESTTTTDAHVKANYELLKATHAVMQESQIFIPLEQSQDDNNLLQNPMDCPGWATAETVRYLRYNHLDEPETMDAATEEMLNSVHPEEFGGGALYWKLVTTLVLRGCLDRAWDVLAKHSLLVSCTNGLTSSTATDPYDVTHMNQVVAGFHAIRELLSRAPLPGGRSSLFDDFSDDMDFSDDLGSADYYLEGLEVADTDYRFWEKDTADATTATGDYPVSYNQEAAIRKHRLFRDFIFRERKSSFDITRRVPEIDSLLSILTGDFSRVTFDNWKEKLLAELLYRQPDLRPRHMSARARKFMQDCGEDETEPTNQVILNIMDGNAGEAIQAMYTLGGGSGAALPSVLTALLYSLFSEAYHIPSDYAFQKLEYLTEASSSIISSLAESQPGVGARQAIRLLLPYATQKGNISIVAAISEILEHQAPQTDAEARSLLALCRPLVERKSVRILDGCTGVALYRYRWYLEKQQPGGGIDWLLNGIELESLVYTTPTQGSCYRTLTVACNEASDYLMQCLNGIAKIDRSAYLIVQAMVAALREAQFDTNTIPAVREVNAVLPIFDSMLKTVDYEQAASQIVTLLKERKVEKSGTCCVLARASMHWPLLRVATMIFDKEEEEVFTAAFDKDGVCVLSDHLMQFESIATGALERGPTEKEVCDLRAALGRALARAFVAENATKKLHRVSPRCKHESINGILSTGLGKRPLTLQEDVVRSMLD